MNEGQPKANIMQTLSSVQDSIVVATKDDSLSSPSEVPPPIVYRQEIATAPIGSGIFPQGCQISPDGLCVLTAQSHELLLYNTVKGEAPQLSGAQPEKWTAALRCPAGDSVRCYQWYPHMDSDNPATCCFIGTARDQPIHLYDAYTGATRATYRPYNRMDEMESPTAICFGNNGQSIIAGGFRTDRMLHLFDLNRPGRDATVVLKLGKTRRSKDGQKGLVSALCVDSSQQNLLAIGTYSPGSIYLYDLRAQTTPAAEIIIDGTCVVGHGKGHSRKRKHFVDTDEANAINFSAARIQWYQSRARGGITQVEFSSDGLSLYSASRRSSAVLQWDLRRLSGSSSFCPGVGSYATVQDTNQRLEFCLDHNNRIYIGGQDKSIRIYDLSGKGSLIQRIDGFQDAVNGISVHNAGEKMLMATAVGSRQFPALEDWENDSPYDLGDAVSGCLGLSELRFTE